MENKKDKFFEQME